MARCFTIGRTAGRRHSGFTIVEVLVALVVLSVGLLGIAKLVLFASRANDSAYLRSQATELAYEILDNMRGNRQAAATQSYDTPVTAGATLPSPLCVTIASPCTPAQLAAYDVYQWKRRLVAPNGALPSGKGSVVTSTTVPTTATITVTWDDESAQNTFTGTNFGNAATMSVVLETVL